MQSLGLCSNCHEGSDTQNRKNRHNISAKSGTLLQIHYRHRVIHHRVMGNSSKYVHTRMENGVLT